MHACMANAVCNAWLAHEIEAICACCACSCWDAGGLMVGEAVKEGLGFGAEQPQLRGLGGCHMSGEHSNA